MREVGRKTYPPYIIAVSNWLIANESNRLNNFAISSAGIGEALKRSASALAAGGNTIDESIALITAANSVVQNPETVGTALKTLSMRLRGTKTELEEAGEDTEGMVETTAQLQAKLKALTDGKVDIMLDQDTFKSTTQILREMAGAWEDMTDIEQASALELMGGKRQANTLAAVLENFDIVEDVIATSLDSEGSALAENEKYLSSIQGHIDVLNNSMETLWMNAMNSNVIKFFIDVANIIVNITDKIGLLNVAISSFLAYRAFKSTSILGGAFIGGKGYGGISFNQNSIFGKLGSKIFSNSKYTTTQATPVSNSANAQTDALAGSQIRQGQAATTAAGQNNTYTASVNNIATSANAATTGINNLTSAQSQQGVAATASNGTNTTNANSMTQVGTQAIYAADGVTVLSTVQTQQGAAASQGVVQNTTYAASQEAVGTTATTATAGVTQETGAINAQGTASTGAAAQNQGLAASNTAVGATATGASIGVKLLNSALTMGISLIAGFAISKLIEGFMNLMYASERTAEAADKVVTEYQEAQQTIQSTGDTISQISDEYVNLSQGVNSVGENISLTTDEYERYNDLSNQIADMLPSLVTGFTEQGDAILSCKGSVELLTAAYNELIKTANNKILKEGTTVFDNFKYEADNYRSNVAHEKKIDLGGADALKNILNSQDLGSAIDQYAPTGGTRMTQIVQALKDNGLEQLWGESGYDFIKRSIQENKHIVQSIVDNFNNQVSQEVSEIRPLAEAYVGNALLSDNYSDISKEAQSIIKSIISQFDFEFYDQFDSLDSMYAYLSGMLTKFNNLSFESTSALKNIPELYTQFTSGDMSYSNYAKQLNQYLEQLKIDFTDKEIEQIKNSLGLDEEIYSEAFAKVYKMMSDDLKSDVSVLDSQGIPSRIKSLIESNLFNKIGSLSSTDLQVAGNLDVAPGTIKTWNELLDAIREVKASAGIDISSTKTYSSIVEWSEKFNEAQKQTSEIVVDNTEVTQEYKDALIELGISSEDLNECFYESNPLIVKNANALNKLVKTTKTNYAQNAKLAKSQARLQYYEQYKKLLDLTKGKKIENAATLAQVKAIYEEMTALEKSIARYSLLEQQLLGATNAYEKFAEAQEIDEANDYETQAEEMVGYLVDAFHTAKLGTESAQAAIKGLVPESVYEDIDTLDGKMQAVYDYFTTDLSKYFYVKFNDDGSMESAEMLIDNVKQFVEDGIGNGVFTGSWEEWDLDSSIHSLDELADKMNVTKEVAFAFLQAMETYDISWIGGDASTLLDKLIPNTTEIKAFGKQMQEEFDQTPIDLTARVKVSSETMQAAGWDVEDGSYSTLNTVTYMASDFGLSDENGQDYAINVTPILPDGTVIDGGEDGLWEYINGKIQNGESLKNLDIFLGSYKTVEEAEAAAKRLHELQEDYYSMVESYSLENAIYSNTQKRTELEYKIGTGEIKPDTVVGADGKTTAQEQLNQLNKEADENAQAARDNITEWSDATEAYNKAKQVVSDLNEEMANAKDGMTENGVTVEALEGRLQGAEETMWDTYAALVKIGEPTEVTIQVAKEALEKDIKEAEESLKKTFDGLVIKGNPIKLEDLYYLDGTEYKVNYELVPDGYSTEELETYVGLLNEQYTLDLLQGDGVTSTLDVLTEIKNILSNTYDIMVESSDAQEKAEDFVSVWDKIKDKTVTLIQNKVVNTITDFFKGTPDESDVNGTAHIQGTAFAGGSWGASRTETALTGELGPEILVRDGHWTTVGENGAEFTQIKKGDIVFNHKQSEQLLKNGYVTGRGKAYASGTAFAAGAVHPWTGGMSISKDWNNITPTLWNTATNGKYLEDSVSDASDAADDFAETLDWIEIRLEEINEQLDLMNAKLENAVNYTHKNNIINEIIGINNTKISNLTAGIKKYSDYAAKLLSKVPSQYRDAAQNGAIAITDFAGEANEATVEAINNYREWAQKVTDLKQQLEEVKAEIKDLAIQKFDNAYNTGDIKSTIEDSKTEKLQTAVDYDEEKGLITSSAYYTAMMKNSNKKIEFLTTARNAMQKELDMAVQAGHIVKGSDEWHELVNQMYEIDTAIDEVSIELEEFQNAINDIYWDNFDELINRLDYLKDETQSLIDLMDSDDLITEPTKRTYKNGTVEYWTADDVDWTDEGIASLGLYAQQMEIAEYQSKQYAKAIDDLNNDYKAGKYSEIEYLEKLNELKSAQYDSIEAYYDAQDAIVELNETRIDSIKEGIEAEIDAYSELIDKKKEELDVEKDLYDFQKSANEQAKNIADIQRKIAALSGDNSASAVAKRKQLEADLLEAQQEQEELYYDRSIEKQQEALDKELEDFQTEKDAEIEKWDEYLTNVETVVTDSLGIIQSNATGVYDTLNAKAQEYNLTLSDSILTPWQDGALAVSDYQTTFDTAMSSTMDQLEALKNKWQEVIDKMAETGKNNVAAINKENSSYNAATKTPAPAKPTTTTNKTTTTTKTIKTGGKINAGSAKIYSSIGGQGYGQYFSSDPIYKVLDIQGNWVKVRHHKASSGVTGWFKKSDVKALSIGTKKLEKSGIVNVDELGEELILRASNGRLTYLEKGSGVIPADLTSNLMQWGELNPQDMIDRNRPQITPHNSIVNNNMEFKIDASVGELIHVERLEGGDLKEINKVIDKAWDKKMQGLNNAIKKFSR